VAGADGPTELVEGKVVDVIRSVETPFSMSFDASESMGAEGCAAWGRKSLRGRRMPA
jgi:hypothetical protein